MRGFGEVEALRTLLPDAAIPLFALLTQLGDVWFVFVVLAVLYWVGGPLPLVGSVTRRQAALVIALALGGLSLTVGLKQLFGLPRPPMPGDVAGLRYVPTPLHGVYRAAATADGFGFPSGHAITTTVVWGGLAAVLDVSTPTRRTLVAGTVVALVALARVALGVHYAVDVLAGIVIALVYLVVVLGIADGRPRRAFWMAVVVAVAGTFVGPTGFDGASTLGATVGATVAWELVRGVVPDRVRNRRRGFVAVAVGLLAFGGVYAVVYVVEPSVVPTAAVSAVVIGGLVALPVAVDRT